MQNSLSVSAMTTALLAPDAVWSIVNVCIALVQNSSMRALCNGVLIKTMMSYTHASRL